MLAKIVAPGVIEIMGGQTASPLFRLQTLHGVLFLVLSLLILALIRRQRRSPPDQKFKSVLPGLLILVP
jgi:predicted transporter